MTTTSIVPFCATLLTGWIEGEGIWGDKICGPRSQLMNGRASHKWRGRGPCGDRFRRATSAGPCGRSRWSRRHVWTPTHRPLVAWSRKGLERGTKKKWFVLVFYHLLSKLDQYNGQIKNTIFLKKNVSSNHVNHKIKVKHISQYQIVSYCINFFNYLNILIANKTPKFNFVYCTMFTNATTKLYTIYL